MKKYTDDYHWPTYSDIYENQCREIINNDGVHFLLDKTHVENGKVLFEDKLYPSWQELYHLIIEKNIKQVFECGCGPAYHLYNIKKLNPAAEIHGCELLESQIKIGVGMLKIPSVYFENIYICDFTIPNVASQISDKFEFVFTHTVTQHLRHELAVEFIKNMEQLSSKYIFLVENRNNHDYDNLFKECGLLDKYTLELRTHYPGPLTGMLLTKKSI